jgi:4a-hydroxytetrahydrobiopterin dehydratase
MSAILLNIQDFEADNLSEANFWMKPTAPKPLYKIKSFNAAMERLSINEIHQGVGELKGWEMTGHAITKEFRFKDFKEAMDFVNKTAEEAERADHHPDILIRYNKVTITLTTHAAHGITHNDFKLAKIIEQLNL